MIFSLPIISKDICKSFTFMPELSAWSKRFWQWSKQKFYFMNWQIDLGQNCFDHADDSGINHSFCLFWWSVYGIILYYQEQWLAMSKWSKQNYTLAYFYAGFYMLDFKCSQVSNKRARVLTYFEVLPHPDCY